MPPGIDTDRERLDTWSKANAIAANKVVTEMGIERKGLVEEDLIGYNAPFLDGIWLRAPYLHNGSVPTLWHLMHPARRPARFQVGGHALDWTRVGIAGVENPAGDFVYPAGHVPWSEPELYDTRRPGLENSGHEREFDGFDEGQKDDLLEYLKVL